MKEKILYLLMSILYLTLNTSCVNDDVVIDQEKNTNESIETILEALSRDGYHLDSISYPFVNVMKGEDLTTAIPVKKVTQADALMIHARMELLNDEIEQYKISYTADSLQNIVDEGEDLFISYIGEENYNEVQGMLLRYSVGEINQSDITSTSLFNSLTYDGKIAIIRSLQILDDVILPLFPDVFDLSGYPQTVEGCKRMAMQRLIIAGVGGLAGTILSGGFMSVVACVAYTAEVITIYNQYKLCLRYVASLNNN